MAGFSDLRISCQVVELRRREHAKYPSKQDGTGRREFKWHVGYSEQPVQPIECRQTRY
jgi:hypothetical protein